MSVLCYHSVDESWDSPLAVLPRAFEQQCAWLARHKRVLGSREVITPLAQRGRLDRGTCVLTFDDGFAALREHAVPSLVRHQIPATIFLVAATLESAAHPVDWLIPPEADPPGTLTRDHVLELNSLGFDFGSHSWAHQDLRHLSESECLRDLKDSRTLLEDLLKKAVPLVAYPYGFHTAHVRRAAQRAGYEAAFSLPDGPEEAGAFALPRAGVYRHNSLNVVRIKSHARYLALRTSRIHAKLRATTSA